MRRLPTGSQYKTPHNFWQGVRARVRRMLGRTVRTQASCSLYLQEGNVPDMVRDIPLYRQAAVGDRA